MDADAPKARTPTEVVEIRVHGVNNTAPQLLLRTRGDGLSEGGVAALPVSRQPALELVAGDEVTGFYRWPGPSPSPTWQAPRRQGVTEAYSWGQLTSGVRGALGRDLVRGAWAVLLPFAMANAAHWARPTVEGPGRRNRSTAVLAFLVRLLGLSLTVTLTVAASGIGLDQLGWQCAAVQIPTDDGTAGCRPIPLLALNGLRPWWLGVVVPLALVAVLWAVAGRSFQYEAVTPTGPPSAAGDHAGPAKPTAGSAVLEDESFWSGSAQVRALGRLHLAAAVSSVAWVLSSAVVSLVGQQSVDPLHRGSATAAAWFAAIGAVWAVAGLGSRHVRWRSPEWELPVTFWGPLGVASVALLLALVAAADIAPRPVTSGQAEALPRFEQTVAAVFVVQAAVVAAILVMTLVERRRLASAAAAGAGPAWRGLACPLLAGAGWAVGMLYSVAVLSTARVWFERGMDGVRLARPAVMQWSAIGLALGVLVFALVAAASAWTLRRLRASAFRDLGGADATKYTAHERARLWDVASARAVHEFIGYRLVARIGWLTVAGAVITAGGVLLAVQLVGIPVPGVEALQSTTWVATVRPRLVAIGEILTVLLLVGITFVVSNVVRSPNWRRSVGVLWDLATFFPRACHPLGPPCTAERSVPELVTRVRGLLRDDSGRTIILAGHSQGAALCVATVLQLRPEERERLALLTFGTQLTRLHGRIMPAVFGPPTRTRLRAVLSRTPTGGGPDVLGTRGQRTDSERWRSLWRPTDYLGWPIDDGVDAEVVDPEGLTPRPPGQILDPPIRKHSDYPLSQEYLDARALLAQRLLPQDLQDSPDPLG